MDRFRGRLKTALSALMITATMGFIVFALCVTGALDGAAFLGGPGDTHDSVLALAYGSGILGGFAFNCTVPLFFEITMELIFGWCSENTASSLLIFINTVVQIVFLAVPTEINGSSMWMNWLVVASFIICTVPVLFLKVPYVRSNCEAAQQEDGGQGTVDVAAACDELGCF